MVQTEGVTEFVDRGLGGSLQKLLGSVVPEPGDRYHREPIRDRSGAEHEVQPGFEQVDVRPRKDTVALLRCHSLFELGRQVLDLSVPIPPDERIRHRLRRGEGHPAHVIQFFAQVFEDFRIDASEGLDREVHPFTTPSGTIRATIFVRPAPSATRTTSSTFLYAPGASSTIPARDAARR